MSIKTKADCYHCGLPVPSFIDFKVEVNGTPEQMCCLGCKAACEAILFQGLIDYYQLRKDYSNSRQDSKEDNRYLEQFDDAIYIEENTSKTSEGLLEARFKILGITCPACCWLVEKCLSKEPALSAISVNYAKASLVIRFNPDKIRLTLVAQQLLLLGFYLQPLKDDNLLPSDSNIRRQILLLVVSGFGMAQVMMFSLPKYFDIWGEMSPDVDYLFSWLSALMTTFVISFAGSGFFMSAYHALKYRRLNMDVPISLAITAAYLSSLHSLFFGGHYFYYDSICMLIFLLLLSRYVQNRGLKSSSINIFNLYSLIPTSASCFKDGKVIRSKLSELCMGDLLLVRPGEAVPLDICLDSDTASIAMAHLTGESAAVTKVKGDFIPAGCINLNQGMKGRVVRVGEDTSLAQMIRLVEWAQGQKPNIATMANQVASKFTLVVCTLAMLTLLIGAVFSIDNTLARTIAVLVVSCPCALSLATPAVVSAAISAMLGKGVLLRNANALECLSTIDTLVVDKTGTLTESELSYKKIICHDGFYEQDVLAIVSALEQYSAHPMASAFKHSKLSASSVQNHPGLGISGIIESVRYFLGSKAFLDTIGVQVSDASVDKKYVYLANETHLIAKIIMDEQIKPGALTLVERIKNFNIKILMVSGDRISNAIRIANKLGISNVIGDASPEEKMQIVRKIQATNVKVAMLGDGVNDTPVLACADVSIAMGSGADIAKQESDLILLSSDVSRLGDAIAIAKKAKSILTQNMAWAGAYNLAAIPFAILGIVTPWMAAIGMSVSSIFVVLNALRVNRR